MQWALPVAGVAAVTAIVSIHRARTRLRKLRQSSIFRHVQPRKPSHTQPSTRSYEMECEFKPRPSDVIVATYHKTGTTLVTHICHQVRVVRQFGKGSMDFEDYYFEVPWTLLFWDLDMDPRADHFATVGNWIDDDHDSSSAAANGIRKKLCPRVFKSHRSLATSYERGRYIVTVRDPLKTLSSLFWFLKAKEVSGFESPKELLSHPAWLDPFNSGDIYDHYLEAWQVRCGVLSLPLLCRRSLLRTRK